MILQPALVDDNGDINLHGRQGATIPIQFLNPNGTPRDMSGKTVTFEVGPTVNIALVLDSSDHSVMNLNIANLDVKAIFDADIRDFVVIETIAGIPTPHWRGTVYVAGWTE